MNRVFVTTDLGEALDVAYLDGSGSTGLLTQTRYAARPNLGRLRHAADYCPATLALRAVRNQRDPCSNSRSSMGLAMAKYERAEALRAVLQRSERALPTSRFGRLWRFGRSAAGMAGVALGRSGGESERELEAVARLVSRAGELKGLLMKAGQIFGYIDPSMPDELRALLSVLHTCSQAAPGAAIEGTLREAFGSRAGELLARLDPTPIAVASIAQVHRAELASGAVAVKILHRGIAEAVRKDFDTAGAGAAFARLLGPGAADSVASNIEEARTAILEECDLALEAERQTTFERLFAGDDGIIIPAVRREWCTPSVLTSDWCPGRSLDALGLASTSSTSCSSTPWRWTCGCPVSGSK
jgi:predicted unusual protein kinase regulating ubiquinone biosynthesis (AarF/ABC1/UbiB family)